MTLARRARRAYNGLLGNRPRAEDAMTVRSLAFATVLVAMLALLLAPTARSEDRTAGPGHKDDDVKTLQGRWQRKLVPKDVDAHGGSRAVKAISGDRETVTYFDESGQSVYATTADFKLEQAGPVKIYTYSNLKVTQAKEGGTEAPQGNVSYIYRVEGDQYYEAHGLLTTSPAGSKPRVVEWQRLK
jgi:hypothetical protein